MTADFPLITIGIPCYNAVDTISRAIQSAFDQDWPNTEIVVIDDGSTDGSQRVIKSFNEVKFIQNKENEGPGGVRQTIINNANGDFLAFFDDDDIGLPNRISEQYKRITQYEEECSEHLIACYCSGERHYPNNYVAQIEAIGSKRPTPYGPGVASRLLFFDQSKDMFFGGGTPSCSLMARVETFHAVGGFDSNFRRVEDVDFAIRLALAGGHFIGTTEKVFRQYATNAADKSPERNLAAEQQLADKYRDYLDSIGKYHYARTWPLLRYYHFKRDYIRAAITLVSLGLQNPIQTLKHIMTTGPKRLIHERKMRKIVT